MTETEPEFDVEERDSWYANWEYDRSLCPHCGNLRVVCSDPEQDWYPQRHVCYATAARAVANRMFDFKHDPRNSGKAPREHVKAEARDGVTVWVSQEDLTPEDDFI